jgi:hypothetical protein
MCDAELLYNEFFSGTGKKSVAYRATKDNSKTVSLVQLKNKNFLKSLNIPIYAMTVRWRIGRRALLGRFKPSRIGSIGHAGYVCMLSIERMERIPIYSNSDNKGIGANSPMR